MSWQTARDEAQRWIDTLQLAGPLTGKTLDLREQAKTLKAAGSGRKMVLEAARRALIKRGAVEVIFE